MINWAPVTWRNVRPSPSILLVVTNISQRIHSRSSVNCRAPTDNHLCACPWSTERFPTSVWIFVTLTATHRHVFYARTHTHTHRRILVHKLESDSNYSILRILTSTYLYSDGTYYASQLTLCWLEYRFPLTRSLLALHTGRQGTICRTLLLGFRTRRRISCTEIKEKRLIRYMDGRIVTSALVTLRPTAIWVC